MNIIKKTLFIVLAALSTLSFGKTINEKQWLVYVKEHAGEKFSINFPKDPDIKKVDSTILLETENEGINYSVYINEKRNANYLTNFLEMIKESKHVELLNHSISEKRLEMLYQDKKSGEFSHVTIVTSEKNTFTFFTLSEKKEGPNHNYFVGSLELDSRYR